ncbi:hypothetical protein PS2_018975 [Malus domestica]
MLSYHYIQKGLLFPTIPFALVPLLKSSFCHLRGFCLYSLQERHCTLTQPVMSDPISSLASFSGRAFFRESDSRTSCATAACKLSSATGPISTPAKMEVSPPRDGQIPIGYG